MDRALGKVVPGSPASSLAGFPQRATAWDLNYRGDLAFLAAAAAQPVARAVSVDDGWALFLRRWLEALRPILDLLAAAGTFARLTEAARPYRPATFEQVSD